MSVEAYVGLTDWTRQHICQYSNIPVFKHTRLIICYTSLWSYLSLQFLTPFFYLFPKFRVLQGTVITFLLSINFICFFENSHLISSLFLVTYNGFSLSFPPIYSYLFIKFIEFLLCIKLRILSDATMNMM